MPDLPINLPGSESVMHLPGPGQASTRLGKDGNNGLPAGRVEDRARIDNDTHGCVACPHPCIGPAFIGSPTVFIDGRGALRMGDQGTHSACCGANIWKADAGSSSVYINDRRAHRKTDATAHCGGEGTLVTGSPTVLIGGRSTRKKK